MCIGPKSFLHGCCRGLKASSFPLNPASILVSQQVDKLFSASETCIIRHVPRRGRCSGNINQYCSSFYCFRPKDWAASYVAPLWFLACIASHSHPPLHIWHTGVVVPPSTLGPPQLLQSPDRGHPNALFALPIKGLQRSSRNILLYHKENKVKNCFPLKRIWT